MKEEQPPSASAARALGLRFWGRVVFVALQLVLVYYFGDQGVKFFYQGF